MRTIRMMTGAALVGSMAWVTQGGVAAGAEQTAYAGEFAGHIAYVGCTSKPKPATTTGTWSITLHGTSAKGTFDILVNGEPHVSYVYLSLKQLPVGPETTFSVSGVTQAGPLTVNLLGGQMTYTIAPYNYNNLSCTSVTYPGHT